MFTYYKDTTHTNNSPNSYLLTDDHSDVTWRPLDTVYMAGYNGEMFTYITIYPNTWNWINIWNKWFSGPYHSLKCLSPQKHTIHNHIHFSILKGTISETYSYKFSILLEIIFNPSWDAFVYILSFFWLLTSPNDLFGHSLMSRRC
jgi:hypothetical protein